MSNPREKTVKPSKGRVSAILKSSTISMIKSGGCDRDRTCDPLIKSQFIHVLKQRLNSHRLSNPVVEINGLAGICQTASHHLPRLVKP